MFFALVQSFCRGDGTWIVYNNDIHVPVHVLKVVTVHSMQSVLLAS